MNINKRKNLLRDFILVFCMVFSFYAGPIPFIQVSMISGLICLCLICAKKKVMDFLLLMLHKKCRCIFVSIYIIITSCFFFSSIHLTADTTYTTSMLSLLFKTICIFAVVEVIYDADKPLVYYEKILIHIFVVQTFIQLLGYFYRPFSDIIVLFNHAYKLHSGYDGIRGLGLSGGTGSGLGWAYGLAIILYTKVYLIETKKITISSVAVGLFLFLGIFFSARTGFLGCILSAIYFVFSPLGTLDKIKKTGVFIFILALIIGIVYLVFYNWISIIIEKVLPYVFEFFYNKAKTGRLETVSTDTLFEMWKTSQFIDEKNFLLGDGWFTDPITGRYYHQTDVGYLRNMFYWGFIGTLINYIGQIYVFKGILLSRNNSGDKRFVFYLLLFEFIVELKANTVSFSHITMIFFIYYILIYTKHFSNGLRTCQRL